MFQVGRQNVSEGVKSNKLLRKVHFRLKYNKYIKLVVSKSSRSSLSALPTGIKVWFTNLAYGHV